MGRLTLAALAVVTGLSCRVSAQPAALEGIAVNTLTGEPLSGVHIRLLLGLSDRTTAYGAISRSDGHFSISSLEPGSYMLQPQRRGFVYVPKPGTSIPGITLKAGEQLTGFKLEMTPEAVIAGRVLDEDGDPVEYAQVNAEPVAKDARRGVMFRQDHVMTDERGEFRIIGAPGKYRVKASPMRMGGVESEIRTDGILSHPNGPTYYPGVASADHAGLVEASAGGETNGIEIRLQQAQRGLTISGTVSGLPENALTTIVSLQSGETPERMFSSQGRGVAPDGKFTFQNLEPRFYRIYARYSRGKTQLQSAVMEFRLDNTDVTNLNLALEPGGELAGTLEIAGTAAAKRTIRLEPGPFMMMFDGASRAGEVDNDGVFHIADVLPGRYKVYVDPLEENGYIKEMRLDGTAAENDMIDVSRGVHGAQVKIKASLRGGQIEGRILDKDGAPMINAIASVLLAKDPEQAASDHFARVTEEGKYSFHAIRPGKYRLIAMDAFHSRGDDTESRKKAFASAPEIEIKEGDRVAKDVKVASDNAN